MSLFTWINSRIQRYHWYHISLIKLSVAGFVLLIAKFWPPLLGLEWYWYAGLAIVAGVPPIAVMFGADTCLCKKCQCNPCTCAKNDADDIKE